ncbi:hypothetical protein M9H77_19224 [Catharanthus roseus]|uniref:Uncharacterized protein n=1 Tax=Catharanthus roseus TaxID=4058 RepID=A0ACC0B9Q1_CATRO|nr:hypothetical protein M9H77_19224 [Catharanthus roseus]
MEVALCSVYHLLLLLLLATINSISALQNDTDRLALLDFKRYILDDPYGTLESWNDTVHHCLWQGITCNTRHQRVMVLNLRGKTLSGSISPRIGNISFLEVIHLGENLFHGEIPQELGRLFRLTSLNISFNLVSGEIPVNLSRCSKLSVLHIGSNYLEGKIPVELGSLKGLEYLILQMNNFSGEIPNSLGNLSSLNVLSLSSNNLRGNLPKEIGQLTKLVFFSVGKNGLTGTFPTFLYNLSKLTTVGLGVNNFYGNLPEDIGLGLSNLQSFGVGGNNFQGKIPISFGNATKIYLLDLPGNKFVGKVPHSLGNLPNLRSLNIDLNLLGHNSSSDLDFLEPLTNCTYLDILSFAANNFGGELPGTIGNLSTQLSNLLMGGNMVSGTIPQELARFKNLYILSLASNLFSGTLPNDIGKLEKLQILNLGENMLFGHIPSDLFNITLLYSLRLEANNFGGTLHENLGNCQSLKILDVSDNNLTGGLFPAIFTNSFRPQFVDLSHNSLSGSLPPELGKLANINVLNISNNKFSGQIPKSVGDCLSLEYLAMEGNFFTGNIPDTLASLKGIQYLDLSRNNLTGKIPRGFESLTFLKYLNLSFNNLEGEIPNNGVFGNTSQIILTGNSQLCGGIPQLRFPSCPVQSKRKKKKTQKLLVILLPTLLSVLVIFLTMITLIIFLSQRRRKGKKVSTMPSIDEKILRVSYQELHHATSGFSQENIIGSGGYGIVYKGSLAQFREKMVAIKVLDFQKIGVPQSFKAECRALKNIRHRNLVSLLTYCSSIDLKRQEFKALVYDFMENGSLDMWLHSERSQSRNLNFLQRLKIAINVASALDYLHNQCGYVIVHCDLKPSNVLLDNDFIAHVGDFGLARLLKTTSSLSGQDTSNSVAIKGSIGYAPPEYGMGGTTSTRGDVYSYGILLLEMLTGKRPTNEAFVGGLDLHNYVKMNLASKDQVVRIIDPRLLSTEIEENGETKLKESNGIGVDEINVSNVNLLAAWNSSTLQNFIVPMFEIALKCSERSPNDRMDMNEVLRQFEFIRDHFASAQIK